MKSNIKLDIQGKRFGLLTAIKPVRIETGKKVNTLCMGRIIRQRPQVKTLWECKCDCGKTTLVKRQNLIDGNTQSCGCRTIKCIDRVGQRYGHLVVLSRDYEKQTRLKASNAYWKCQCDCGKITSVSSTNIQRAASCGCFRPKNVATPKYHSVNNMIGKKFRTFTVLERDYEIQKACNSSRAHWKCRCDCGKITTLSSYELKHKKLFCPNCEVR